MAPCGSWFVFTAFESLCEWTGKGKGGRAASSGSYRFLYFSRDRTKRLTDISETGIISYERAHGSSMKGRHKMSVVKVMLYKGVGAGMHWCVEVNVAVDKDRCGRYKAMVVTGKLRGMCRVCRDDL